MNRNLKDDLKNAFKRSYIIIILLITSIVIGYEYHHSFVINPGMKKWQVEKFQRVFLQKEKDAQKLLDEFKKFVSASTGSEINRWLLQNKNDYHNDGYSFYVYKNDTIAYWSTNISHIPYLYSASFQRNYKPIELGNAIYYTLSENVKNYIIVCLIKIKENYSIQNNLLTNEYQKDFKLNHNTTLSINHCLNCMGIYNHIGKRVFSLDYDPFQEKDLRNYRIIYLFLQSGIFFLFILFILVFTRNVQNKIIKNRLTLFWVIFLFGLRIWFMYKTRHQFFDIELFNPSLFAASDFLTSLGDLMLHAIFFFIITILFYENFRFRELDFEKTNYYRIVLRFYMHAAIIFSLLFWFEDIFHSLIINSNISFEIYKVLTISKFSVFAILSIVTVFIGICILFDKFLLIYSETLPKKVLIKNALVVLVIFIVAGTFLSGIVNTMFMVAILVSIFVIRISGNKGYNLSRLTLLVFIFSVFSVYYILTETDKKQFDNKKVLAVNLSTEHDYITEMLLDTLSKKIKNDKRIFEYLEDINNSERELLEYINGKYFRGYLDKYKTLIYICAPHDSLYVTTDDKNFHCYGFFSDYVNEFGISVPNTSFYFMNNLGGRIAYFGAIVYNLSHTDEFTLFIELRSKLVSSELGYPELLIDKDQQQRKVLSEYSYAKYNNQELMEQSGEFQYPLRSEFNAKKEFERIILDGYKHVIYYPDDENVILISSPKIKSSDILFTFSYLFLFFMLSLGILVIIYKLNMIEKLFLPTFRNKIQFSMILVLIISLILIGGFTIYYSTQQYKEKHYEFISEKLQSVRIELEHKLSSSDELASDWYAKGYDNLDELLRKFSNVFFSDIHLYDPEGNLLASSRPEIFNRSLQGSKINPEALFQMKENNMGEFIHNEEIGSLSYLSGYLPFFNYDGDLLAYLNLPYFTRQKVFSAEITSLVVAVLNIYVLLFLLTIALAFVMSEQITHPLKLIQDSFRKVKLGIQNEVINYEGEDEIAGLIKEYNRMVVELTKNAEKLAKSEREMAWREMARQIAHEIKNPLTPMKLQIQQLQRTWKNKPDNWDDLLNRVSTTLIEQINTLSSIATEFSNFAKMPKPKNEVVNLVTKLENTIQLFEQTENITFQLNVKCNDDIAIYADKEQISRVFTNLFKNAIQSIPEDKKGLIEVHVSTFNDDNVRIEIIDNGRGIPKEIHNSLFQPNFTTKSGGMGLGLSIVKKIVDTTNGNIYFSSEPGKGTCFTLEWEQFK